jgi:hypothetical protein
MVRKKFQPLAQTPAEALVASLQPHGGSYTLSDMLFAACEAKMPILVAGFLAYGADPSLLTKRSLKMQPLHMSCMMGDVVSAAHLIRAGAPLDNTMNTLQETPLHMACSIFVKSDEVAAQLSYLLLSHGATQGQRNHLLNRTARQTAKDLNKPLTGSVLLAFANGRQDVDTDVLGVAQSVQNVLAVMPTQTLELFNTEIQNPAVQTELAEKLQRSWCNRPEYQKISPHL